MSLGTSPLPATCRGHPMGWSGVRPGCGRALETGVGAGDEPGRGRGCPHRRLRGSGAGAGHAAAAGGAVATGGPGAIASDQATGQPAALSRRGLGSATLIPMNVSGCEYAVPMKRRVQRYGGSLVVTIPAEAARRLDIHEGDEVVIEAGPDAITVRPARSLAELVAGWPRSAGRAWREAWPRPYGRSVTPVQPHADGRRRLDRRRRDHRPAGGGDAGDDRGDQLGGAGAPRARGCGCGAQPDAPG